MFYSVDTNRTFQPMNVEFPLIHMFHSWEILEKIITEGFRPSYCTEYLFDNNRQIRAAFPMISFSNMEITSSLNFLRSYGTLAIAMKKEWGERNKLNPVLYLERNSDLTNHIINSFDRIKQFTNNEIKMSLFGGLIGDEHILVKTLIDLFSHSKNYDGILARNETLINDKYSFGLEREWRHLVRDERFPSYLIGNEVDQKKDFSKKIEHLRLTFLLEDIDTIVVETEYEEKAVVDLLESKFGTLKYKPKILLNTIRHMPDYS